MPKISEKYINFTHRITFLSRLKFINMRKKIVRKPCSAFTKMRPYEQVGRECDLERVLVEVERFLTVHALISVHNFSITFHEEQQRSQCRNTNIAEITQHQTFHRPQTEPHEDNRSAISWQGRVTLNYT